MSTPIRMLLIDHSIVFREMLMKRFVQEAQVQMLPPACDPFDALHKVNKYLPDVIICANELPFLSGIELIKKHFSSYKVPIIAMSVSAELEEAALQAGAADFVVKPEVASYTQALKFTNSLLARAMRAGQAEKHWCERYTYRKYSNSRSKVIAIGAITDGTKAIVELLSTLPSNCPPVLLLHQTNYGDSCLLAEQLKEACTTGVKEAIDGESLRPGTIMVAPAHTSVCLKSDERHYYIKFCRADKDGAAKPSLDCFFESVAATMGCEAVGVLMLGSLQDEQGNKLHDGVRGLNNMKRAGAQAFARVDRGSLDEQAGEGIKQLSPITEVYSEASLARQLLQTL